ncbi:MAG: hypothetical protein Q9N02_07800 [Ghiorsea sp.]|nr:hypothetical protein [Ghiorsea sp.]
MYKLLMLVSVVVGLTIGQFSTAHAAVGQSLDMNQKLTAEKMQTLRVMISKLRDLIYNLRDINQLEETGMPRQDVLLMKNILQQKISLQSSFIANKLRFQP